MLADVAALGFADGKEAADVLLEKGKVASVPGRAFYTSDRGRDLVRFCFAKDRDSLERACRQIREFAGGTA
jgi:aminotransferase